MGQSVLDNLLLDSFLSDNSISQAHSKCNKFKPTDHIESCNYVLHARALALVFSPVGGAVALECLSLLCQYFNANFP